MCSHRANPACHRFQFGQEKNGKFEQETRSIKKKRRARDAPLRFKEAKWTEVNTYRKYLAVSSVHVVLGYRTPAG